MCQQLREIYDKKSPIFLIEIVTLICTCIIYFDYPHKTCFSLLQTFYILILVVSLSEILMKTLVLTIIYCLSRETANLVQSLLTIVYLFLHIGLWIYSIVLLNNP